MYYCSILTQNKLGDFWDYKNKIFFSYNMHTLTIKYEIQNTVKGKYIGRQ